MAMLQSPSLYVGDLLPDCTEANLWELFSKVGLVSSLRLCRDNATRKSRGYAYVNFQQAEDADRALNTLNHSEIATPSGSKVCRISWADRDSTMRKGNVGNVFVKNLPLSYDSKRLNDIFSVAGNISSCTVRTDDKNQSIGLGYVQFDSEQAALDAIEKLDQQVFEGKTISVAKFVRKADRPDATLQWRQVYCKHFPHGADIELAHPDNIALGTMNVKNLPAGFTEADLRGLFSARGNVTYAAVSGSVGIVTLDDNDKAQDAAKAVNGTKIGENTLEVAMKPWGEVDIVTHLMKSVPSAKISGTYVARDETGASKGFAITTFETHEDAVSAVSALNSGEAKSFIRGGADGEKKIVLKACRSMARNMRQKQVQEESANRKAAMNSRTVFVKNFGSADIPQLQAFFAEHKATAHKVIFNRRYAGTPKAFAFVVLDSADECARVVNSANDALLNGKNLYVAAYRTKESIRSERNNSMKRVGYGRGPRQFAYAMPNYGGYAGPMQPPMPYFSGHQRPRNMTQRMNQGNMRQGRPVSAPYMTRGFVMHNQVRNPRPDMMPQPVPMAPQQPQQMIGNFDINTFSTSPVEQQRQMIGEELYPRIYSLDAAQAGKITGMLLEMEVAELLHLMQDPVYLENKVKEAQSVLSSSA